jgi:hypothetical protein
VSAVPGRRRAALLAATEPIRALAGARVQHRLAPRHTGRRPSTADPARPLPVTSTSVFSRWDGVVDWRACLQRPGSRSENVGVHAGHLGMGHDPAVLWVVADRLAQPAGERQPFRPPPGLARLFPSEAERD